MPFSSQRWNPRDVLLKNQAEQMGCLSYLDAKQFIHVYNWWQYFSFELQIKKKKRFIEKKDDNWKQKHCRKDTVEWKSSSYWIASTRQMSEKKNILHIHSDTNFIEQIFFWRNKGWETENDLFECTCPYFYDAIIMHK